MSAVHYPSLDAALPDVVSALARPGAAVVLCAPPGTGKTTRVPLALLGEAWAATGRIVLLEPRRVATRAAARRMAHLFGDPVGQTIGYRVRFDNQVSDATRIEVLTEGLLVRRLQSDPALDGVSLVIFDELHERHLQTDLSLALTLDARAALRPDLRLLVMSATLDADAVASRLGDATVIEADGEAYPVRTRYLGGALESVGKAVVEALREAQGDILVFLPGAREIRTAERELKTLPALASAAICPLHGAMDAAAQDRAIRPHPDGMTKVILATNIAESSLTIDGVRVVIDSGLARVPHFDASAALTRLRTERISRDSADQRRGRAARQGPGLCLRLWSVSEHERLARTRQPELMQADLAPALLQCLAWGAPDLASLPLLTPPPTGHEAQARDLLLALGAVNEDGRLNAFGREMANLPVHPRLAAMLCRAHAHDGAHALALACRLAALVEEGLPWRGGPAGLHTSITDACEVLAREQHDRARSTQQRHWDAPTAQRVARVERALRRLMSARAEPTFDERLCGELLLYAFPDRVAQRTGPLQFRMSNGRRLQLARDDALAARQWLVAAETSGERHAARLYIGAPCTREAIEKVLAARIRIEDDIGWDTREQLVRTQQVVALGRLELERAPLAKPDPHAVAQAMLAGVRELGLEVLPWTPRLTQLRARVMLVRCHDNDADWPDLSDAGLLATLEHWLAPYLSGCTRRAHLQSLDLDGAIRALLGFEALRELDRQAPERLPVPAGGHVRLTYAADGPPVLAVPLQDMFGATETPSVLRGRLPVQIHLLSPARRPLQVTQDLVGFWQGQYAAVRKEMRGRYPKHYWPEDPMTAPAGVRTGKRRPSR